MKTTEYLYGASSDKWSTLPYEEALTVRIQLAAEHKHTIADKMFNTEDFEEYSQLNYQVQAIDKAIEHNRQLFYEIKEKD